MFYSFYITDFCLSMQKSVILFLTLLSKNDNRNQKSNMQYPLISEYVDAIRSAEDNFDKLCNLRPVLDNNGNPVMSSGNFAVVFKMKDVKTGKLYAVKCFTKEQEGREEAYRQIADELEFVQSTYLAKVKYCDKELFVDTNGSDDNEFPVLLMDWVEGETLDKYIRQNINDTYALEMLAYNFSRLAMWLLPQPFAHGDLKPNNILVQHDGSLALVDYDGMFVPAMHGQKSRELGSPDFRHPLRSEADFNEHIDDFPAISILLSLRLIAFEPSLLKKYGAADRLLFTESDYCDLSSCQLLKAVFPSQITEVNTLVGLFTIASIYETLVNVSYQQLVVVKPQKQIEDKLSTEVTAEDLEKGIEDEFGIKYSWDGKRLLKGINVKKYKIKEGIKAICNGAFSLCSSLQEIYIPNGVTMIGNYAFLHCDFLREISIPKSMTNIGNRAFEGCSSLLKLSIHKGVTSIGYSAFEGCSSLRAISIPKGVTSIENDTFSDCSSLQEVSIPEGVTNIGDRAFWNCVSLLEISIPKDVTNIGKWAFRGCKSLQEISISKNVTNIGNSAFEGCGSLLKLSIPENVTSISYCMFGGCSSLQEIYIPESVTNIDSRAFWGCSSLREISIPNGVVNIGEWAFRGCKSLQKISIPKSVTDIGDSAFFCCTSLREISIPEDVKSIGCNTFYGCRSLLKLSIPKGVTSIGNSAFSACQSLLEMSLPKDVASIDNYAFKYCYSLRQISIPEGVTSIGDDAFGFCSSLHQIIIPSTVKKIGTNPFSGCKCKLICNSPLFKIVDNVLYNADMTVIISFLSDTAKYVTPDGVTNIGDSAFRTCRSLQEISILEGVKSIGNCAFKNCYSLQEISIPKSVTSIGDSAFGGCPIHRIKIPKGNKTKFKRLLPNYKDKLVEV